MSSFLQLAKSKGSKCRSRLLAVDECENVMEIYGKLFQYFTPLLVAKLLTTVCATGGGAFKFEDEFHKVSGKPECLMSGMHNSSAL